MKPEDTHPAAAPRPGLAVVVGAGGGLGAAMLAQLQADGSYARVLALGRSSELRIDYAREASIAAAAQAIAGICGESGLELQLLLVASGFLHGEAGQPERSWSHLDAAYLQHVFLVNTLGPALLIKHLFPLLPKRGPCVAWHGGHGIEPAFRQNWAQGTPAGTSCQRAAGGNCRPAGGQHGCAG